MNIISVNASEDYDVIVGNNILSKSGEYAAKICGNCKAAVISDSNVFPIYGSIIENSINTSNNVISCFGKPLF